MTTSKRKSVEVPPEEQDEEEKPKLRTARQDPIIYRMIELAKGSEASVNLERIENEIDVLHKGRTSRKLYKAALEPTSLAEAALRDMSNRARLSELKSSLFLQKRSLEAAYEAGAAHLATKYNEDMKRIATNSTDRKYVVNKILARLVARIAQLDTTAELLEIAMKDIDTAGFALRNATEMLKLLYESRGRTV